MIKHCKHLTKIEPLNRWQCAYVHAYLLGSEYTTIYIAATAASIKLSSETRCRADCILSCPRVFFICTRIHSESTYVWCGGHWSTGVLIMYLRRRTDGRTYWWTRCLVPREWFNDFGRPTDCLSDRPTDAARRCLRLLRRGFMCNYCSVLHAIIARETTTSLSAGITAATHRTRNLHFSLLSINTNKKSSFF